MIARASSTRVPSSTRKTVRVSILIPNFNYARYLPDAIDSAVGQTYRDLEVIVVDDGSTDESRGVISSYGERVIPVLKRNGGQASALNAGFQHSRGDIVCFLDADDVFAPNKVEQVVAASRAAPDANLIHHQLQMIDGTGTPFDPPFPWRVPDGDVRSRVLRAGGWFPHAVVSALSFRRPFLERLFPMPVERMVRVGRTRHRIKMFPDTYLAGPAALVAPIAGINAPLALRRTHDTNATFSTQASAADQLIRYQAEVAVLAHVMREEFGRSFELRMEGHMEYQLLRYAAREISRVEAAARVLRSPSGPLGLRLREALRVSAMPRSRFSSLSGPVG
jgi:hypothetical protein